MKSTVLKRLLDSKRTAWSTSRFVRSEYCHRWFSQRSVHGYTRRLEGKVEKLEETLKARRDVDKAVKILVALKQIGEAKRMS